MKWGATIRMEQDELIKQTEICNEIVFVSVQYVSAALISWRVSCGSVMEFQFNNGFAAAAKRGV